MNALAALEAAESLALSSNADASMRFRDAAADPQLETAELLAKMEMALLAEAKSQPTTCGRALDRAAEIIHDACSVQSVPRGHESTADRQKPGSFFVEDAHIEDALAKALARMEVSLLHRTRCDADKEQSIHTLAVTRADQAIRRLHQRDELTRCSSAFFKTGMSDAPKKRPVSASNAEHELRIRQRAYDDKRRGRTRNRDDVAFSRPVREDVQAQIFAAVDHCFKRVKVRRDENGRLQPKISNRIARMAMPTFLGMPIGPARNEKDYSELTRLCTEMVWTEAYNSLDPQYPTRSLGGAFSDEKHQTGVHDATHDFAAPHGPPDGSAGGRNAPAFVTRKICKNRAHRSDRKSASPSRSPIRPHDHHLCRRVVWEPVPRTRHSAVTSYSSYGGTSELGIRSATPTKDKASSKAAAAEALPPTLGPGSETGTEIPRPRTQLRPLPFPVTCSTECGRIEGSLASETDDDAKVSEEEEDKLRRGIEQMSKRLAEIEAAKCCAKGSPRSADYGDCRAATLDSGGTDLSVAPVQRAPRDFKSFVEELNNDINS